MFAYIHVSLGLHYVFSYFRFRSSFPVTISLSCYTPESFQHCRRQFFTVFIKCNRMLCSFLNLSDLLFRRLLSFLDNICFQNDSISFTRVKILNPKVTKNVPSTSQMLHLCIYYGVLLFYVLLHCTCPKYPYIPAIHS